MKRIEQILQRYQLTGPYPQEQYERQMETGFGRDGNRFLEVIDASIVAGLPASSWRKSHNAKNSRADMSLYISSHVYTPVYRGVLTWLAQNIDQEPESFIDLGCENGLLTLCMADLWPGAKAHSIDQLSKAVSVARTLAAKFDRPGVTFSVADLARPNSVTRIPAAPIVVGTFLFHELLHQASYVWANVSSNVAGLLQDSGRLITINRFPYADVGIARLNDYLEPAGLYPVARDSLVIDSPATGRETFPIVVYARDPGRLK